MHEPGNALPLQMRAQIVSIGLTVQREMDQEKPDFDFLINIVNGLLGMSVVIADPYAGMTERLVRAFYVGQSEIVGGTKTDIVALVKREGALLGAPISAKVSVSWSLPVRRAPRAAPIFRRNPGKAP